MIRHIFKMVWNRKGKNSLLIVEVFFSFLALFGVMLALTHYAENARQPLGFDQRNVWRISVDPGVAEMGDGPGADRWETFRQLEQAVRQMPEVETTTKALTSPYSDNFIYRLDEGRGNEVDESFASVFRVKVTQGRWFTADDETTTHIPVVINELMARSRFGDRSPIGQRLTAADDRSDIRVVGVVSDFRQQGEYSPSQPYTFYHLSARRSPEMIPKCLLVRTRASEGVLFEQRLTERLRTAAKDWVFDVEPMSAIRAQYLENDKIPLLVGGLVVGFLLIMVGLGLAGVQWQNVTRRTQELGVRRAGGATAAQVAGQVLGEALLVTSFGVVLGVLVIVQLPLLDLLGFFSPAVYTLSLVLSALAIYLLTLGAAFYPSRLATRIQPADALRYE